MGKYKFFDDDVLEKSGIHCRMLRSGNFFSEIAACLLSEGVSISDRMVPMLFDIFIRVMFAEPCLNKDDYICMLNIMINENTTLKEIDPEEFAKSDRCEIIRTAFEKMANNVMAERYSSINKTFDTGINVNPEAISVIIKEFTLAFNDIMRIGRDAREKYESDWEFELPGYLPSADGRQGCMIFSSKPIVVRKKDGTVFKANGVVITSVLAIHYIHDTVFIGDTFGNSNDEMMEEKNDA